MRERVKLIIILQLFTMLFATCTKNPELTDNNIAVKVSRGILGINHTFVVAADGSGRIRSKLPRNLGDEPDWTSDGEWIVFSTEYSGDLYDSQVFVMRSDGSKLVQVTTHDHGSWEPTWSPDGTQIAYEASSNIYILNVECIMKDAECDFTPVYLTVGFNPDWSPDGNNIAYTARGSLLGSTKLQVIDIEDPEHPLDLTPLGASVCLRPQWSPDGTKLAVSCYKNNHDIYIIEWGSLDTMNLTDNVSITDIMPVWSPDGSMIAFVSDRDEDLGSCLSLECTIQARALYVMNSDGTNIIRVTHRDDEDFYWLAWLPE